MSTPDPPTHDPETRRLLADLDRAGELRRSVLDEALALPRQPGEERLAAAPSAGAPARRRRVLRILVAAVAAAVLAALVWRAWSSALDGPARVQDDSVLGSRLALVEPLGETASFGTFRWEAAERASWYVVVVLDRVTGAEVDRSPQLDDTRWQVPPERWRSWPRAIRWEVRPFDASGRAGAPASGEASLAP